MVVRAAGRPVEPATAARERTGAPPAVAPIPGGVARPARRPARVAAGHPEGAAVRSGRRPRRLSGRRSDRGSLGPIALHGPGTGGPARLAQDATPTAVTMMPTMPTAVASEAARSVSVRVG